MEVLKNCYLIITMVNVITKLVTANKQLKYYWSSTYTRGVRFRGLNHATGPPFVQGKTWRTGGTGQAQLLLNSFSSRHTRLRSLYTQKTKFDRSVERHHQSSPIRGPLNASGVQLNIILNYFFTCQLMNSWSWSDYFVVFNDLVKWMALDIASNWGLLPWSSSRPREHWRPWSFSGTLERSVSDTIPIATWRKALDLCVAVSLIQGLWPSTRN